MAEANGLMRTLLRFAAPVLVILLGNGCCTSTLWARYRRSSGYPERITGASIDEHDVLYLRIDYKNGRSYIVSGAIWLNTVMTLTDYPELPASTRRTEIIPPPGDSIPERYMRHVDVLGNEIPPARKAEYESFVRRNWQVKIDGWDDINTMYLVDDAPVDWCHWETWVVVALTPIFAASDLAFLPVEIIGYLGAMWTFNGGVRPVPSVF